MTRTAPHPDTPDRNTRNRPPAPNPADEPEITQEESVPVDRRDTEGERLMEQLGDERRRRQAER